MYIIMKRSTYRHNDNIKQQYQHYHSSMTYKQRGETYWREQNGSRKKESETEAEVNVLR